MPSKLPTSLEKLSFTDVRKSKIEIVDIAVRILCQIVHFARHIVILNVV